MALPSTVRRYLAEPPVAGAPARVWRDWAVVGVASAIALLEFALRTDDEWSAMPTGWRVAWLAVFGVFVVPALLARRTRPLRATLWAFGGVMTLSLVASFGADVHGGLFALGVVLLVPYGLYRWGSGRDGLVGGVALVGALVGGNLSEASATLGDWIGGAVVLAIPVELGLIERFRTVARERAIAEARSRVREDLARELHDTVAHHVSAIAVQAQAGRAVAATDPAKALAVLGVIEEAASRTLHEMRAMVGTLRAEAEFAPAQGVADLARLATGVATELAIVVEVDETLTDLPPAVDAAIYRIAQESITNAIRHARHATRVSVRVRDDGQRVQLVVTDDGTTPDASSGRGFGLLGMAERAHLLGGELVAGPADGHGWRVVAGLPRERP